MPIQLGNALQYARQFSNHEQRIGPSLAGDVVGHPRIDYYEQSSIPAGNSRFTLDHGGDRVGDDRTRLGDDLGRRVRARGLVPASQVVRTADIPSRIFETRILHMGGSTGVADRPRQMGGRCRQGSPYCSLCVDDCRPTHRVRDVEFVYTE